VPLNSSAGMAKSSAASVHFSRCTEDVAQDSG